jgi:hypothetical protein
MRWLKNRILNKMCELQSGEVRDFWRKEHDDELHSLYSLHNIGSHTVINTGNNKLNAAL